MKVNLLASAAATLLTFASLVAVSYNVPVHHGVTQQHVPVTTLPTIHIHATAADLRNAALLADRDLAGTAAGPERHATGGEGAGPVRLLDSPVAMPYYSFGNTLGRISKE